MIFSPFLSISATLVLLPVLNNMFDITTRRNTFNMHPPSAMFLLLFFLSCLWVFVDGFVVRPGRKNWLRIVGFAALASLTIGAILEIL